MITGEPLESDAFMHMSYAPSLSFETTYRNRRAFVKQLLRRLGVDVEELDDAAQDVFIVVHRRWEHVAAAERMNSWLCGICVKTASNYRRTRRRRARRLESQPDLPEAHADCTYRFAEDMLLDAERLSWLTSEIDRLGEHRKQALVLTQLEQRSATEVSGMTGLPANTIASRLRAAMLALRRAALREQKRSQTVTVPKGQ